MGFPVTASTCFHFCFLPGRPRAVAPQQPPAAGAERATRPRGRSPWASPLTGLLFLRWLQPGPGRPLEPPYEHPEVTGGFTAWRSNSGRVPYRQGLSLRSLSVSECQEVLRGFRCLSPARGVREVCGEIFGLQEWSLARKDRKAPEPHPMVWAT